MSKQRWDIGILLGLFVLDGLALKGAGRWDVVEVPDTPLYVDFSFSSLESVLSQNRTPGYPALLAVVRTFGGTEVIIPVVQCGLFWGAVAIFAAGLVSLGCPRPQAALIAGSMLAANILTGYVQTIASETSAAAAGVASVGCLLRWHGQPRQRMRWGAALIVCLTAAWMIRPVYMVLIAVVPLASVCLWVRSAGDRRQFRQAVKHLLLVGLMGGLPLAAWCGLRWAVVGEFAVVSWGGYNLVGVSGQFLDDAVVLLLDEDLQPLARAAIERRREIPVDELPMEASDRLNYMRMELQYDLTIWRMFEPAAASLYDDLPTANSELRNLGVDLIRARPRSYFVWLLKASRQALRKLLGDFAANPLGAVLICLTVLAAMVRLVCGWWSVRPAALSGPLVETTSLVFLLAVLYAVGLLALTILVCPPLGRMTDAAGVLMLPLATSLLLTLLTSAPRDDAA